MYGDAMGERGGLDCQEDPRKCVAAGNAVGQSEPLAQPGFMQRGELLHHFIGAHPAEHSNKGHEEDSPEIVPGVAIVAWITQGVEGFKSFRKTVTAIGFVWISWNSGRLKPQDNVNKLVRRPRVERPLMRGTLILK